MKLHTQSTCHACKGTGKIQTVNPEKLRDIREAAGLSIRAMARKLGFSAPYLSDVERGRRNCTHLIEDAYLELR